MRISDWSSDVCSSDLGVSFEDAQSVFYDEFAVQFYDEPHSSDEERFLMLGMSSGAQLLLACHCERDGGGVVRFISARKATKQRSEERSVGKECVSKCSSRCSQYNLKKRRKIIK